MKVNKQLSLSEEILELLKQKASETKISESAFTEIALDYFIKNKKLDVVNKGVEIGETT